MRPYAFIEFLVYFQGVRDYFECHEVLEEEWLKGPPDKRKSYWKGFIAIAVSQYHHRRGNFKGARRAMENAVKRLQDEQLLLQNLGLDAAAFIQQLTVKTADIRKKQPYKSMNLPILDHKLTETCRKLSGEKGCIFGNASDMSDKKLIDKHKMPNRDAIISKREEAYRNQKR